MIYSKTVSKFYFLTSLVGAILAIAAPTSGQVTAPSTFTTGITVQGEPEGSEFDDWIAAGIPIATSDDLDNPGFIDVNEVQIANDNEFIYIRVSFHDEKSVGAFLGFDLDQDVFTGFDVFSAGLAGVELGYVNDFPFEQAANIFNTNDPLTGGPIGNGGALIFPFFNIDGPQKEYAIPLDVGFTNPTQAVFTDNTFNLLVYTDQGIGDVSEVITYTLAEAPDVQGDFDSDLDVDGADFIEWQREFGDTLDANDLADWQANYAMGVASTLAATSVPEPSSSGLAMMLMIAYGMRPRR